MNQLAIHESHAEAATISDRTGSVAAWGLARRARDSNACIETAASRTNACAELRAGAAVDQLSHARELLRSHLSWFPNSYGNAATNSSNCAANCKAISTNCKRRDNALARMNIVSRSPRLSADSRLAGQIADLSEPYRAMKLGSNANRWLPRARPHARQKHRPASLMRKHCSQQDVADALPRLISSATCARSIAKAA